MALTLTQPLRWSRLILPSKQNLARKYENRFSSLFGVIDLSSIIMKNFQISLKIKQLKTANGQFLFTPKNIEVLGGHVEALVSKWEVTKSLAGIKGECSHLSMSANLNFILCFRKQNRSNRRTTAFHSIRTKDSRKPSK